MIGREKRALLALVVGGAVLTLALAAGVLAALPALLAFGPLLAGRYLGAAKLDELIERRLRPALLRPATRSRRPRGLGRGFVTRGGRLIASSLAKRPPPPAPVPA